MNDLQGKELKQALGSIVVLTLSCCVTGAKSLPVSEPLSSSGNWGW